MVRNNRKVILVLILILLMCFTLYWNLFNTVLQSKEGYKSDYTLNYTGIDSVGVIYEGNGTGESWKYINMVRFNYHRKPSLLEGPYQRNSNDYFYVDLYDTKSSTKDKIKTLDLISIVQDYNKSFLPFTVGLTHRERSTENWVLEVVVFDFSESIDSDGWSKYLAIDIDSEQVIGLFESGDYIDDGTFSLPLVFSQQVTNVYEKLKASGFSYYDKGEEDTKTDYISTLYFTNKIDYSDLRLAKMYPKSLNFMNEGNSFSIVRPVQSRELARLLGTEDEVDVFEGVTLYGAYSKDGQDHVVKSYDDLMNWYQAPEGGE